MSDETGSVIIALLVAAMLASMALGLQVTTSIDTTIASHDHNARAAFYMAEAGLHHTLAQIRAAGIPLEDVLANVQPTTADGALPSRTVGLTKRAHGDGGYTVSLVATSMADGSVRYELHSSGFSARSGSTARARIEESGSGTPLPAQYLFNNPLQVASRDVHFRSSSALHAHGDLYLNGRSTYGGTVSTTHDFETGDSLTVEGQRMRDDKFDRYVDRHSEVPRHEVPEVDPFDHEPFADFRLTADGKVYDGDGTLLDGDGAWGAWQWGGTTWTMADLAPSDHTAGTYFVEGNVEISGQNGQSGSPLQMSLITTGSIRVSGQAWLDRDPSHDVLMVAGGDLELSGDALNFTGHLLVHEQLKISGQAVLNSSVVVENATNRSSWVRRRELGTRIEGIVEFIDDGTLGPLTDGKGGGPVRVTAWYSGP